jgi:hypothetical protein
MCGEDRRLRRRVEELEDDLYDLQRKLRRRQRAEENAPDGSLCTITYRDFAECVITL